MDSGATAHLSADPGILLPSLKRSTNQSVIVGDGSKLPVTSIGSTFLTTKSKPLCFKPCPCYLSNCLKLDICS